MATPVQSRQEVLTALQAETERLRGLGVRRLGLFGSFAREAATADSDVDLLVEFEAGQKTFDHFMELAFFLEDLLQRRVELLTPESLSPYIGPRILAAVQYVPVAA